MKSHSSAGIRQSAESPCFMSRAQAARALSEQSERELRSGAHAEEHLHFVLLERALSQLAGEPADGEGTSAADDAPITVRYAELQKTLESILLAELCRS